MVLAGGRASRMGGQDKGLIAIAGQPMVGHVLARLRPQVRELLINANRNEADYAGFGAPVVADRMPEFPGPLAGMASGLAAATTPWVVTAPCDSPLVPRDLVARLQLALQADAGDLAVVESAGRLQPVFALLPVRLLGDLEAYLAAGERKIDRWFGRHRMAIADFSDCPEAFINVNTPEERDALEHRLHNEESGADRA
nr:molybdenum cofactor guanylyltransferase MobA [Methylonatrum kenyense]